MDKKTLISAFIFNKKSYIEFMLKNIITVKQKPEVIDANTVITADSNFIPARRTGSLAGKLLVAAPSLQETCFTRAVIYMCSHSEAGAMGITVNYPVDNVGFDDIMEQLKIENAGGRSLPIHFGGPVESNRGFIVHSDDFTAAGTIYKNDGLAVTSNAEVLQMIAKGQGPKQAMLTLGYAGWSAGQLEAEMESGSWIVVSANRQLVFETDNEMKWSLAIASLGFDVGNFSTAVGHA